MVEGRRGEDEGRRGEQEKGGELRKIYSSNFKKRKRRK